MRTTCREFMLRSYGALEGNGGLHFYKDYTPAELHYCEYVTKMLQVIKLLCHNHQLLLLMLGGDTTQGAP